MANYNTFVVVDCKARNLMLVTSSAKKAASCLTTGIRIEVWNDNSKVVTVYDHSRWKIRPYILLEREYIRKKQEKAERRHERKRRKLNEESKPDLSSGFRKMG